jgi:two-component system nitrogen regulation sensor histidine kinase GlnL
MELWITSAFLGLAAISCLGLAGLVVLRTHRRTLQLLFAVLCVNLALWALGVLSVIQSDTVGQANFGVRVTFVISAFLLASFYQFVCYFPKGRFDGFRSLLIGFYASGVFFSIAGCWPGSGYIRAIIMPGDPNAGNAVMPQVEYGPIFHAYTPVIIICFLALQINLIRKMRRSTGIELRQIQHVLLGVFGMTLLATVTNVYAPAFGVTSMEAYGPVFIVLLVASFSYAMVRYHLLDIWVIISRTAVYFVATSFVVLTFFGSISWVRWTFFLLPLGNLPDPRVVELVSTLISAVIIAWVLAPLNERMQLLANRTILKRRYDVNQMLARTSKIAARHVKLDDLLQGVCEEVTSTIGAENARVMLCDEKDPQVLVTEYSSIEGEAEIRDTRLSALVNYTRANSDPIVMGELARNAESDSAREIVDLLEEMETELCIPLKTSSNLAGVLLLGPKYSKDIYSHEDVVAFTSMANPLATAIVNARLYRRLEEANLHRERILRNMRGGVVAVDTAGRITTLNQGTVEIFGRVELGAHMDVLPVEIGQVLRKTLDEERSIRDFETEIFNPREESIPVVTSSAPLHSGDGVLTGAMVMIYDLSQVKRLEHHVKRADRLSSIGTLAAGMAHEIKNPLVSIKTFSQLLPKRFDDEEFRQGFSDIVPSEVDRIDSIVTRLLDFARPKKADFAPYNIRAIIEDVFALVENQTRAQDVCVETSFPGPAVIIFGDEQQLHQVFLNLVLNAVDAMEHSVEKKLRVSVEYGRTHLRPKGQSPLLEAECATVSFSDTGSGMSEDAVDRIFTPFYTTKDTGTGLGLAVVHGIITEHGGQIDVNSSPNQGTTFVITLPLASAANVMDGATA